MAPPAIRAVRRAFVDGASGQFHVRQNGRMEGVPLLCLHQSPASSLSYLEILPHLARRTIAVDTPGFGESFRPTAKPSVSDYARWIAEIPAALGIERIDVMGLFTGAAIAAEMARSRPDLVRRVVLAGPPLFTREQRAGFVAEAWPVRPVPDGSHLTREWQRTMLRPLPIAFERRVDHFNEYYRGGMNAIWGEEAVAVYPLAEVLPQIHQPTLVLRPTGIHGDAAGAAGLLTDARLIDIDCIGYAMMQAVPETVAAVINDFLDEEPRP